MMFYINVMHLTIVLLTRLHNHKLPSREVFQVSAVDKLEVVQYENP